MKQPFRLIAVPVLLASVALCGCGSDADLPTSRIEPDMPQTDIDRAPAQSAESDINSSELRITLDEGFMHRRGLSGVCRRFFPRLDGTYTVEYVHTPFGEDRDETLDYKLELKDDNTFTLTAVAKGVTAEHYGRWYTRRDEITMYYDEPVDPTAHNVYMNDRMYGEILNGGKIMIYENCHTVVLAKTVAESE